MLKRSVPFIALLVHAFLFTAVTLVLARMAVLFDGGARLPWITVAAALLGLGIGLAPRLNGRRRPRLVTAAGFVCLLLYIGVCGNALRLEGGSVPAVFAVFAVGSALGPFAPPLLAALSGALGGILLSAAFGVVYERPRTAPEPSMLAATALGCALTLALRPVLPPSVWGAITCSTALACLLLTFAWARLTRALAAAPRPDDASTDDTATDPPPRWAPAGLARHACGPALIGLLLGAVGLLLLRVTALGPPLRTDAFAICLLALAAGAALTPFLRRMRAAWIPAVLLLGAAAALLAAAAASIPEALTNLPLPGDRAGLFAGVVAAIRDIAFVAPWPFVAGAALLIGAALQALSPQRARMCTTRVTLSALVIGAAAGITAIALLLPHLGSLGMNADDKAIVSVHETCGWVEVRPRRGSGTFPLVTIDRRADLGPVDADQAWARQLEAHLPLLLHPAPRRVLVLGEITGEAARAALRHPDLEVEVSWLSPALSAHFGPALLAEADRLGRARPIFRTAGPRVLLDRSPGVYDVIVDLAGRGRFDQPVSFYTREYAQAARRALRPHGRYALWIALDRAPSADLEALGWILRPSCDPGDLSAWCGDLYPRSPALGLITGSAVGLPPQARDKLGPRLAALGLDRLAKPGDVAAHCMSAPVGPTNLLEITPPACLPSDAAPLLRAPRRAATAEAAETADRRALAAEVWQAALTDSGPPAADRAPDAAATAAVEIRRAALVRLRALAGEAGEEAALDTAYAAARRCLETTSELAFVRSFVRRTGDALLGKLRIAEAEALWDLAIAKAPDWGAAHLGRADLLFRNHRNLIRPEDWKPLKARAERALALDETLARAWIYAGIADLNGTGDFRSARGCFENSARIDPDDPLLKAYLWRFFDADGRYEEAAALLLDALAAFPDDIRLRDAVFKLAPKLRLAGKPRRALYVLRQLESSYGTQAGYHLALAETLETLGDREGAVRAARRCCAAAKPPIQGYYVYLYRLLLKAGRGFEANETRSYIVDQFGYDPGVTDPAASER